MGLNFLGLGFTFGAKDSGLEETQKRIAANFDSMAARMAELSQAAGKSNMGDFASSGQAEKFDKLSASIDALSEKLGKELPENSRKGTEQFQRDATSMESSQRKVGSGFNAVRDSVEKLNTISRQNKLQTFIQAISLSKLNDISDALGQVAQGTNLTTSLEAEMQALSKTTRVTGANFGLTGEQLAKFSGKAAGMAKTLNVDANSSASALRAWTTAGGEMAAMGFKSAAEVAKFSDVFGVSGDVLRQTGLTMRKEFKMTDDQIGTVSGAFLKMGQVTGDVTGAMGDMPQMMDLLRRRAVSMGKTLDADELSKYAASTAALAAGLVQSGQSSEKARATAMALSEQMIESKEHFNDMFGGTQSDISEFNKSIAIAFGDVGVSFDSMTKGPDEFMSGMSEMVKHAKKNGGLTEGHLQVMSSHLQQAFGKERGAELLTFFSNADDATLDLMSTVKKAPAEFGKLANDAHRTGRTLAESFELTKDSFAMNFRAISRKEARAFVKDTSAEFQKFNARLTEIAGEGGLMGAFVKKMSEAHQLGAMAFIPKTLRPMAALMGNMVSEMTPAIGALGAMGFRLKHLLMIFSPAAGLLIGIAALVGWFVKLRMEGKNTKEALLHMGETMKDLGKKGIEKLKQGFQRLSDWFASVDWGKIGRMVLVGIVGAMEKSNDILKSIPWAKIWTKAIESLGKVWQYLISEEFRNLVVRFASAIGERVALLGRAIMFLFGKAIDYIGNIKIGPIVSQLLELVITALYAVAAAVGPLVEEVLDKLPGLVKKAGNAIIDLILQLPDTLTRIFLRLGQEVDKHGAAIAEKVFKFIGDMLASLWDLVVRVVKEFPQFIIKVGDMLVDAVNLAVKAILAIFTGLENYLANKFPESAETIRKVFLVLKGIVFAVGESIKLIIKAAAEVIKIAFLIVKEVVIGIWNAIAWAAETAWDTVSAIWNGAVAAFELIWDLIAGGADLAWSIIKAIVLSPLETIKSIWNGLGGFFTDVWDGIKEGVKAAWDWIVEFVTSPIKAIKKAYNDVTGFASDARDAIFGKKVDYGAREKQRLEGLKLALQSEKNMTAEQIEATLKEVDKSNFLQKQEKWKLVEALKYAEGDVTKAMKLAGDQRALDAAEASYRQTLAAERAADAAKQAHREATKVIGTEANKQASAVEGAANHMQAEVKIKPKMFGPTMEEAAESLSPATAIVVGAKSMEKIGPQAERAFGAAGVAMEDFSRKFTKEFEGKKSIDMVTGESFNRIFEKAKKLKTDLTKTMKDMWIDILDMTAKAIEALNKDFVAVARQLKTVADAAYQFSVAKEKETTAGGEAPKKTFRADQSHDEQMLQAVHWPDWYTQSFQPIAVAMRDSLHVASVSTPTGQGGNSAALAGALRRAPTGSPLANTVGPVDGRGKAYPER